MAVITVKALDEAQSLDDTLSKLLKSPTPEMQRALDTLGVKEYLVILSEATKKRCQNKRLAVLSFLLGVHVCSEHQRLDKIFTE